MDSSRSALRELDRRASSAIGREARLELAFDVRHGRTILARAYAEPPFRIGRTFSQDGVAYVIIVCSGPGIFAGDVLRQTVRIGAGARVVLTSQAALQVHPSAAALPACIRHEYVVEDDAELHCHWDPVIPFAGARLDQRFDVQVAESSRLYWSDAMMAGRVSRGEAWRFGAVAHQLQLRTGSSLGYLERYMIQPAVDAAEKAWIADDSRYLGTGLAYHPDITAGTAEAWHRELAAMDDVRSAVDLVAPRLALLRTIARDGAAFGRVRARYRALALQSIFGGPELLARK